VLARLLLAPLPPSLSPEAFRLTLSSSQCYPLKSENQSNKQNLQMLLQTKLQIEQGLPVPTTARIAAGGGGGIAPGKDW
jgi:hypothetical protein